MNVSAYAKVCMSSWSITSLVSCQKSSVWARKEKTKKKERSRWDLVFIKTRMILIEIEKEKNDYPTYRIRVNSMRESNESIFSVSFSLVLNRCYIPCVHKTHAHTHTIIDLRIFTFYAYPHLGTSHRLRFILLNFLNYNQWKLRRFAVNYIRNAGKILLLGWFSRQEKFISSHQNMIFYAKGEKK